MKHVCVGCVCIHPITKSSSLRQKSSIADSFTVSHVSEVHFCSGIKRQVMKSALLTVVPHKIPHISRLAAVFSAAIFKKEFRNVVGMNTGRMGSPFSRYAAGRNVSLSFLALISPTSRGGLVASSFGGRCGPASECGDKAGSGDAESAL
jgi:hypothetical protein